MCVNYSRAASIQRNTTSTHPDLHLCAHAGIENLADITSYLLTLDKVGVINLGLVLGLSFSRLKTMIDSQTFRQDMLAAWLEKVDYVLQTGAPTWKRLVEALKDPRVGQNGLASKIEQDKLHGMYHTYPLFSLVPRPHPAFRRFQYGNSHAGRAWEQGYPLL